MNPLLHFENIFATGTLAAFSEAAGFPKENLRDWRSEPPYRWRSASTTNFQWLSADAGVGKTFTVDTITIAAHNFGSIATDAYFYLERSANGSSWSTVTGSTSAAITDGKPRMQRFAAVTDRFFRLQIARGSGSFAVAPEIGILTVGRALVFTEGIQPGHDPYGVAAEVEWNRSPYGTFLGSNVNFEKKDFEILYDEVGLAAADFFKPASGLGFDADFIPHAKGKPFWYAWNLDIEPLHVFLCMARIDEGIRMPFLGSTARRALRMSLEGVVL